MVFYTHSPERIQQVFPVNRAAAISVQPLALAQSLQSQKNPQKSDQFLQQFNLSTFQQLAGCLCDQLKISIQLGIFAI